MDIVVHEAEYTRTDEEYDEKTDTVVKRTTRPIKQISFTGVDWVFLHNYFKNQSDADLHNTMQIYRAAVSMMENELTQRRINKLATIRINDTTITSSSTTTKSTKKTKVAKPVDLQGLMDMMKKLNLSMDDVKKMMGIP